MRHIQRLPPFGRQSEASYDYEGERRLRKQNGKGRERRFSRVLATEQRPERQTGYVRMREGDGPRQAKVLRYYFKCGHDHDKFKKV